MGGCCNHRIRQAFAKGRRYPAADQSNNERMVAVTNMYQEARRQADVTQQVAADKLYIGLRTLQGWESGQLKPSDDMVKQMAALYGSPWLGYRHLQETTALGRQLLPHIVPMDLCQAVICMQKELSDVHKQVGKLIEISSDGIVSVDERDAFAAFCKEAVEAAGTLLTLALCGRNMKGEEHAHY